MYEKNGEELPGKKGARSPPLTACMCSKHVFSGHAVMQGVLCCWHAGISLVADQWKALVAGLPALQAALP
jgi:hypothetical protein